MEFDIWEAALTEFFSTKLREVSKFMLAACAISFFILQSCSLQANDLPSRQVRVVYCRKSLPTGEIVTHDCLEVRIVKESERPVDAVYDEFIALERQTQEPLVSGQPVLFRYVFPRTVLSTNSNILRRMQGQQNDRVEFDETNGERLIPIVRCIRDVPAGATISPSSFAIERIKVKHCPGEALGDLWIAIGRKAIHPIQAGEFLCYSYVIPNMFEPERGTDQVNKIQDN